MLKPRSFYRTPTLCLKLFQRYTNDIDQNVESLRNLSAIQREIMESQQTLFQVNLSHVVHQYQRWTNLLPRVKPFYAVKCQPDQQVMNVLADLGAGFDCAGQEEIQMAMNSLVRAHSLSAPLRTANTNIMADNIVFSNPFKFKRDMLLAEAHGIEITSFDSEGELDRLKKNWPTANLLIRVCTRKTFTAKCQLGEKFGVKWKYIEGLLRKAKELNLNVVGISFHVGNMCDDYTSWPDTVEYCSDIVKTMHNIGMNPYILDIGGGFPGLSSIITEEETELQVRFEEMCQNLNSALDTYFPLKYTVIAEPGTYFVHGAYTLATEVIGKRQLQPHEYKQEFSIDFSTPSTEKVVKFGGLDIVYFEDPFDPKTARLLNQESDNSLRFIYILDDGVYGSFNILQVMEFRFLLLAILNPDSSIKNFIKEKSYICKIYGPTCDTLDCISPHVILSELQVGDWLVWADMGAYTNAARSEFSGIKNPKFYYRLSYDDKNVINEAKRASYGLSKDEK